MQIHKLKGLILLIFCSFMILSCKKSYYSNINQNPNVLLLVKPNLLLSTVEAGLAYTQGGDFSRTTSMITQQTFGANSQMQTLYTYGYNAGSLDQLWADLYTTTMENDYTLMQIADAGGYNRYSGISRIIMAYTLQITVDGWGAIPYSKAFEGNVSGGTIHPTYDSGKSLYDTIANLVDNGIVYLNNPSSGTITPGGDDVVYSGNASEWIKFGHAIKARLFLHQSKNNSSMATKALSEIAQSFTSQSDNAQYIFGTTETAANPWYQFNEQRAGNIEFSTSTFAKMLLGLNDPRYNILLDSSNEDHGVISNGHYGGLNNYYGSISSPVEFITYDELLFASAEATLNSGGSITAAQSIYNAAIKANMTKLGVSTSNITTYLAAQGTLSSNVSGAIAQIATQEYIALYLNPEAWTLWRRTNSPTLSPASGNNVPRRFIYPQSELSYNAANVPSSSTLFAPKIFWDN